MEGCASGACDPRRADRRQAILDAAESLFLEQGFDAVSLSAIVKRSGGSLATVYELFENKLGLLRAVVERGSEEGFEGLDAAAFGDGPAADALRLIAHRIHAFYTTPRAIAMKRIVIAESLRNPDFARDFHRVVHLAHVRELADIFRRWAADGKAAIDDPEAAAELYLSTVMCDAPVRAMCGEAGGDPADAERRLDWRLAPFIAYFAIR